MLVLQYKNCPILQERRGSITETRRNTHFTNKEYKMALKCNVDIKNKKMIIEIDMNLQPSKSGKSMVVASTNGNKVVAMYDGKPLVLGVNAYIKND